MRTSAGAFDDAGQARRAVDELLKEGYPPGNIHVEAAEGAGAAADAVSRRALASPEREIAVGPHAMSAMNDFFDGLLGHGEHAHHARTWSEAVRRGSAVAVVDTASETSAERAATVMRELGACDIVERTEQWSRDDWAATAGERQLADGSVIRWCTAHILHRPSGPALSEVIGTGRDRTAS